MTLKYKNLFGGNNLRKKYENYFYTGRKKLYFAVLIKHNIRNFASIKET